MTKRLTSEQAEALGYVEHSLTTSESLVVVTAENIVALAAAFGYDIKFRTGEGSESAYLVDPRAGERGSIGDCLTIAGLRPVPCYGWTPSQRPTSDPTDAEIEAAARALDGH